MEMILIIIKIIIHIVTREVGLKNIKMMEQKKL